MLDQLVRTETTHRVLKYIVRTIYGRIAFIYISLDQSLNVQTMTYKVVTFLSLERSIVKFNLQGNKVTLNGRERSF